MIYLITGNMGTGKTSRAVNMILTNEDGLFTHQLEDGTTVQRPLYFCHIDGLNAAKFNAHELSKEEIQSAPLDELLPTGSVLIIDEAHWVYPVRSASRSVPEYIQKLTELRHDGFTLILITQHPSQLDVFVRNLISKHIHIERKSIGMKQYQWYKCVTDLSNPAAVSGVESSSYKPPKKAFDYYKSAAHHQKFKKKIPFAIIVFFIILGFVAFKAFNFYASYKKATTIEPITEQSFDAAENPKAAKNDDNFNDFQSQSSINENLTPEMFVPTLAERPESKPIYNAVRQVHQFERIAGCVLGGESGCTCYSDQATELQEINETLCRKYATNGLPFDPFKESMHPTFQDSGGGIRAGL